ncbi:MAG: isocitrate lyase, partial [Rhizobiaceae bacterium]|nr:isocitrate lyase [Rhizobiaceae bacterium]
MLDKSNNERSFADFPTPEWAPDRWNNISRNYTTQDVQRLAGSLPIQYTLAENGTKKLWELLHREDFVPTLGTFTGNQAVQQIKAGLKAIYLSGWQVAADANTSGNMYPDQSLYPVDSVPKVVKNINKALQRADQIQTMERHEGKETTNLDFFAPIIADAEAGFGGALNVFELMKSMIE